MKNAIYRYLGNCPPAFELFQKLEAAGDLYLIGGVLREFLDHKKIESLRDIDIVIDIKEQAYWLKILEQYPFQRNRFEGYKLMCSGLLMDTWNIEDTWAFRNRIVHCAPAEYVRYLPETVFLNVDSIIYDWKHEVWERKKYEEAMRTRILDVVLPDNPQILLNIVRSFVLSRRYHMKFSNTLKNIVLAELRETENSEEFAKKLFHEQIRRYRKEVLSQEELLREVEILLGDA